MEDPHEWDYQEPEPVHGSMASAYIMGIIVMITCVCGGVTAIYVHYF